MSEPSEHHDDAEENYFVSLSDLMTGVVFIFVILLCAFAFHYQTESQTAKDEKSKAKILEADAQIATNTAEQAKREAALSKTAADKAKADALEKRQEINALRKLLLERDIALKKILSKLEGKLAARGVRVHFDPDTGV